MLWSDDDHNARGLSVLCSQLALALTLLTHAEALLRLRPGLQPRPMQIAWAERAYQSATRLRGSLRLSRSEQEDVDRALDRIVLAFGALVG